jgi:hypothetical protein
MGCNIWRSAFVRTLTLGILFLAQLAIAQFEPALPPIADPRDTRFRGVTEDWNSPSLSTSTLKPVQPIVGYVNDEHPGYTVELVQLQWRWGDPIDLYVLKPKGIVKPAAILYLYGYPTDTDIFKNEDWQKAVTTTGFAAVGFVSALTGHRYHDRPMREWFLSELPESLATSAHDVQMVLNYLETRKDLDLYHLGMFAHGSGASIAILASAVDPRIKVLDTVDPWGDWPNWMAKSSFVPEEERALYVKPDFLSRVAPLEPINWLPKIQANRFRLQDATFETNTPGGAKEKLRASVPEGASVVVYKTPEDFNAVMRGNQELDWIQHELRVLSNPTAPVVAERK